MRARITLLSMVAALAGQGCGSSTPGSSATRASSNAGSAIGNARTDQNGAKAGVATTSGSGKGGVGGPAESQVATGSDEGEIRKVFKAVWASVQHHDWVGTLFYLTASERTNLEHETEGKSGEALLAIVAPYHPSGIASVSVAGNSAVLVATEPSHTTNRVAFIKVHGRWLLDGPLGGTP